jgi:hypothetical protein
MGALVGYFSGIRYPYFGRLMIFRPTWLSQIKIKDQDNQLIRKYIICTLEDAKVETRLVKSKNLQNQMIKG